MTVITPSAMSSSTVRQNGILRLAQLSGLLAAAVLVGIAMMLGA